jgi:hypothetical protein
MSKVTPACVVELSETVKVKAVVPALPSSCETSLMANEGSPPPPAPLAVMEKLSTERPSSAPEASTSVQRMKKDAPLGMLRLVTVVESAVRLAAALPSFAPVVAVLGVVKSSASTSVYVPVDRSVALVLI